MALLSLLNRQPEMFLIIHGYMAHGRGEPSRILVVTSVFDMNSTCQRWGSSEGVPNKSSTSYQSTIVMVAYK